MAIKFKILGMLAVVAALSACEGTDIERSAMGAVGGALAAEALGTNVAGGALIGGALLGTCDVTTPQFCR